MADTDARLAVAETHIAATNAKLTEMNESLKTVAAAVTALARLEERDKVTQLTLHDHETRIRGLEEAAPITRQSNKWVERVILFICGAVGMALVKFILIEPVQTVKIAAPSEQTTMRTH